MAEQQITETHEETEETTKKKPKLILIVFVVIALSVLGVVGMIFKDSIVMMFSGEKEEEVVEELPKLTFPMETMAVRLSDENRNAYLKISVGLKYRGEENTTLLEEKQLDIQAKVNEVLRVKKSSDLKTIEQTEKLKKELKKEINLVLEQEIVEEIIFPIFLSQY